MTQTNIALGRWSSSKKLPTPSAAKIQQLKDNPTNQMKALFDIAFGPYAAEKALGN